GWRQTHSEEQTHDQHGHSKAAMWTHSLSLFASHGLCTCLAWITTPMICTPSPAGEGVACVPAYPHSTRRSNLPTLCRGRKTCQMLGNQFLGFSQAPQFNIFVSPNRIRSVGDDYGQGIVTVVEVRQHLRDGLAIPGDELALRTAHLSMAKRIPAAA